MYDVPASQRVHIGFFGRRNAGKSSLVNAITGQALSVVSDKAGTTTDAVTKTMELLPLGPVVIIDTPGYDDEGALGNLRIEQTKKALRRCDIAVLVMDATVGKTAVEQELLALLHEKNTAILEVYNKSDLKRADGLAVSAKTGAGIHELKEALASLAKGRAADKPFVGDLLARGDLVVLICPIDASAPRGRLILPQQLVLRDVLDAHASALVVQPDELSDLLASLKAPPRLVITDSQAFGRIKQIVPESLALTSFSVIMARHRGTLEASIRAASVLRKLKDGDRVLIAEACTHHRQCEDIGTVKLPSWIRRFSSAAPIFTFTSGRDFPERLSDYRLIIHCGGCMANEHEMKERAAMANRMGVPFTNYGTAIAYMNGLLSRALSPFNEFSAFLENAEKSAKDE